MLYQYLKGKTVYIYYLYADQRFFRRVFGRSKTTLMWKILVLDDNPDILEAVSLVLSRKQMEVIILEDPAILHEYISRHHPDILLMDIAMGNYDGRRLCKEIKSSPVEGKLPVILFTARNYSGKSIRRSGADKMISKPFRINELYDTVSHLLPAFPNNRIA